MKKKINRVWKKVQDKGHERITFMVIPHGESNIISLQLSKFTIFFGIFITVSIICSSIISARLQEGMKPEVNQLFDTNKTYYYEREQYVEKFQKIRKYQKKFENKLNLLFEMANLSEDDTSVFIDDDSIKKIAENDMQEESSRFTSHMLSLMQEVKDKKADPKEKTEATEKKQSDRDNIQILKEFSQVYAQQKSFKYSSEVVSYRELYLDLKQTEYLLSVFENFVKTRDMVQKNLPYYWPIAGGHFTSFYGPRFSPFGNSNNSEFHLGVDLADRIGTPVFAAADGKVIHAYYSADGYGKNILLQHKFGYTTLYAHLSLIQVSAGDHVYKGQQIGEVGETGRATGPHLHFEVRITGKHINPLPFLTTL